MGILSKFIKKNRAQIFFTMLFLLLQTLCILLIPYFTEEIVDSGIARNDIQMVITPVNRIFYLKDNSNCLQLPARLWQIPMF